MLIPTGNLVSNFISQRFKESYEEFISISLMSVDSWKIISKRIADECQKAGYTTFCDDNFNSNIQIISTSPLMTEQDYMDAFDKADGIILNAFGSGTINTKIDSGFFPLLLYPMNDFFFIKSIFGMYL